MMADTDEELHEMALKIGMKLEWFQCKPRAPWQNHYDVTKSKRALAVKSGAIETDIYELAALMERKRLECIADSIRLH